MSQFLNTARAVRLLGIPMDLGQQRRGVDMGPSALRYAGLFERLTRLGYQVEDAGNVPAIPNLVVDGYPDDASTRASHESERVILVIEADNCRQNSKWRAVTR